MVDGFEVLLIANIQETFSPARYHRHSIDRLGIDILGTARLSL